MEYNRLTKKDERGFYHYNCTEKDQEDCVLYESCGECYGTSVLYRLAELEDKIEQGTLIELPCKVGDTVYWVWEEYTNGKQKLSIEEWDVEVIHIEENAWSVKGFGKEREDGSRAFFWCHSSRFGIWWFLTREEAEKRLKELQNG